MWVLRYIMALGVPQTEQWEKPRNLKELTEQWKYTLGGRQADLFAVGDMQVLF